jgi:hypothetical protein
MHKFGEWHIHHGDCGSNNCIVCLENARRVGRPQRGPFSREGVLKEGKKWRKKRQEEKRVVKRGREEREEGRKRWLYKVKDILTI